MKIRSALLLISFVILWMNTNSFLYADTTRLFDEINKGSALTTIKLAIQESTPEPATTDLQQLQDYLNKNKEPLRLLLRAAYMPPIDFSCYNESTKPEIIPFSTQIPKCVRLLMFHFEAAWDASKGTEAGQSVIASLHMVYSIAGIPYIYGQLLRSSMIGIIFDQIMKTDQNKLLDILCKDDVTHIVELLSMLEKNLTNDYKQAFLSEGKLNNVYITEYLEPQLKNSRLKDKITCQYKQFFIDFSNNFSSESPEEWRKIMISAEIINENFNTPVLTPSVWRKHYLDSIHKLKILQKFFIRDVQNESEVKNYNMKR